MVDRSDVSLVVSASDRPVPGRSRTPGSPPPTSGIRLCLRRRSGSAQGGRACAQQTGAGRPTTVCSGGDEHPDPPFPVICRIAPWSAVAPFVWAPTAWEDGMRKRFWTLAAAAAVAALVASVVSTASPAQAADVLLSQGKPVTASSSGGCCPPVNAVDGSASTRWASASASTRSGSTSTSARPRTSRGCGCSGTPRAPPPMRSTPRPTTSAGRRSTRPTRARAASRT